jgi:hypothetical protein
MLRREALVWSDGTRTREGGRRAVGRFSRLAARGRPGGWQRMRLPPPRAIDRNGGRQLGVGH